VLQVESAPAWALLLETAADRGCSLMGHILCHPYEWMFKLGWGPDEDGLNRHSLGGFLYGLSNGPLQIRHKRTTREWAYRLSVLEMKKYFPHDRMPEYENELEPVMFSYGPTVTTATTGTVTYTTNASTAA
jgi:hypothetical protein